MRVVVASIAFTKAHNFMSAPLEECQHGVCQWIFASNKNRAELS